MKLQKSAIYSRFHILLKTTKMLGINSFYVLNLAFKFKDYSKYPITIFSPVFRFIFTFLLPIAFIAYYPSLVILRPDEVPLLSWLSPFIGVIFFWLSYKFWMFGALKYNGTGS